MKFPETFDQLEEALDEEFRTRKGINELPLSFDFTINGVPMTFRTITITKADLERANNEFCKRCMNEPVINHFGDFPCDCLCHGGDYEIKG